MGSGQWQEQSSQGPAQSEALIEPAGRRTSLGSRENTSGLEACPFVGFDPNPIRRGKLVFPASLVPLIGVGGERSPRRVAFCEIGEPGLQLSLVVIGPTEEALAGPLAVGPVS